MSTTPIQPDTLATIARENESTRRRALELQDQRRRQRDFQIGPAPTRLALLAHAVSRHLRGLFTW